MRDSPECDPPIRIKTGLWDWIALGLLDRFLGRQQRVFCDFGTGNKSWPPSRLTFL